ncbi:MAG: hypothetical protein AB7R40_22455 [Nitrospiraceae bacterium]
MNTYQFNQQLADGEKGERKLDAYFAKWFTITPATMDEQRRGIDRHFTRRSDGEHFTVEYKTDHTAGRTGNAFVETISVDTQSKAGWAITSRSQLLLYYVPGAGAIYVIPFPALRQALPTWQQRYPQRAIPNRGYHTHGILVPLLEFEKIAQQILPL